MYDISHSRRHPIVGLCGRFLLACGALVATWTAPAISHACSQSWCEFGSQIPGDLAILPANLPGIFWHTDESVDASPESIRLVRAVDAQEIPLELSVLGDGRHEIKILEPLAADALHVLTLGSVCAGTGLADDSAPQLALTTTSARPLPDAGLGELIASELKHGPLALASVGGGCSESIQSAYVDVSVTLDAAASPWKDAFMFETRVDGKLWTPSGFLPISPPEGESWLGRGVDRVFAMCEDGQDLAESGLSEGAHDVEIRARIPATDIILLSTKVEVLLDCRESGSTSGDDGTSTTSPGDSSEGDPEPTAAGDPTGADDPPTSGDSASTGPTGTDDTPGESDKDSGCSCRASPAEAPAASTLAAVLLAGLARRRPVRGAQASRTNHARPPSMW